MLTVKYECEAGFSLFQKDGWFEMKDTNGDSTYFAKRFQNIFDRFRDKILASDNIKSIKLMVDPEYTIWLKRRNRGWEIERYDHGTPSSDLYNTDFNVVFASFCNIVDAWAKDEYSRDEYEAVGCEI